MFRALFRWVKAVGYLLTGQIDSARRVLDTNPHVVRARYDDVIREKTARIHQYKQAVAQLIAQEQSKVQKVRDLNDEVKRLTGLKAGALAKAKQLTEELKKAGKSVDAIKADPEYQKCLAAYNDFSSTLAEKEERIAEIEVDAEGFRKSIDNHKVQLQSLNREIEKLKSEASEAVADVITAKQEKEIAETLAGIAQDGTSQELQELREMRGQLKAEAQITKEMAGTDTRAQEAEFLEYARTTAASSEFDALLGLAEEAEAEKPEQAKAMDVTLPE